MPIYIKLSQIDTTTCWAIKISFRPFFQDKLPTPAANNDILVVIILVVIIIIVIVIIITIITVITIITNNNNNNNNINNKNN